MPKGSAACCALASERFGEACLFTSSWDNGDSAWVLSRAGAIYREHVLIGTAGRRLAEGKTLVSTTFVVPYPPGFPVLVPGQVVSTEIIYFLAQLDVKEIHGYNPDLGLSVFTESALAKMEAQRNAAIAAVGTAFPSFELPSDASGLNGHDTVQVGAQDT